MLTLNLYRPNILDRKIKISFDLFIEQIHMNFMQHGNAYSASICMGFKEHSVSKSMDHHNIQLFSLAVFYSGRLLNYCLDDWAFKRLGTSKYNQRSYSI